MRSSRVAPNVGTSWLRSAELTPCRVTLETLHLPRPIVQLRKTPAETVAALDRLLKAHTDEAAARELNRMGYRNWKGEPYTAKRLNNTRLAYGLPSYLERERKRLREQGFTTAGEVADQLGLKHGTVRALGRAANDPRVDRPIIATEGRRYCMYRANRCREMAHRVVGENPCSRNPHAPFHRQNKVYYETRDLSRDRRTRAGSTATA